MAAAIESTWKSVQAAEKELQAALAEKDFALRNIDRLIAQYRLVCERIILQDFGFSQQRHVEDRLWDAHVRINKYFRKQLAVFREATGKKKHVEQRKAIKQYLEFIKSSQRSYRGYIQNLASQFGGIVELEAVARKLNPENVCDASQVPTSGDLGHAVLCSCHQTLVRLGDLSRYRETELVSKNHNWGPAIGYYHLAGAIYPASGASHNQLAVIAQVDANHLRATYHLYRALTVDEPHKFAKGNLELEFKKIHAAWNKGELIINSPHRDSQGPGKALVGWFMRLHARCYNGVEFVEHDELESEVLSQLAIDLKERSLEGTLNKFILINISAEYFAAERLKANPESAEILQSFYFFQRLNVKTMFTLLQVLQPELERLASAEDEPTLESTTMVSADQISAVARRVLPGLRHYSTWLTLNTRVLVRHLQLDTSLCVQVKELWKIYASTLTLLASTFSVASLPTIDYLLEEDEDTLGFKPFENECPIGRYYQGDSGTKKPKWHNKGTERHHPNVEMAGRIRDFLAEGVKLAVDETIPIDIVTGTITFAFREEGMPSEIEASPNAHQATLSSTMIDLEEISNTQESPPRDTLSPADEASQAAFSSVSMNTEAKRMVDDLVGSESAEKDDIEETNDIDLTNGTKPTPLAPAFEVSSGRVDNETTYGFNSKLHGNDFAKILHEYSPPTKTVQGSPRPHLPSIYGSAFAPETTPGSRPSTARRPSPHHSQQNSLYTYPPKSLSNLYDADSTISSMPDPSSLVNPQTPTNKNCYVHPNQPNLARCSFEQNFNYGAIGQPVSRSKGNPTDPDDSDFPNSSVLEGSTWRSVRAIHEAMDFHTPPNGQGPG